ncbi:hypothetical protein [Bradyrhizobium sp. NAS80.1]|uniref:hypothetical protein n=1 Tax=Bradyrhizobium sp. NAS80.1 TaxID=1680159 RepID=UPI000B1793E2|nr:hypothetical protein [Bradyrhizobium sp. NAS80.1]
MAQQPTQQWSCTVSTDSEQARKHDEVTLAVTLSNTKFDQLSEADKETVYATGFDYQYHTVNMLLQDAINKAPGSNTRQFSFEVPDLKDADYEIDVTVKAKGDWKGQGDPLAGLTPPKYDIKQSTTLSVARPTEIEARVTLQRSFAGPTDDRALWTAIRNRTAAIGFERYRKFIDCVFCGVPIDINMLGAAQVNFRPIDRCLDPIDATDRTDKRQLSIYGPYAYSVLKLATQAFLTLESGVVIRDPPGKPKIFDLEKERIRLNDFSLELSELKKELGTYLGPADHLPYLDRIVTNLITLDNADVKEVLPYCLGVLQHRLTSPSLIELIWSYWLEEGMLVQTMNAIARRFQNRRGSPNDPLAELEFDPLRPLNNLIWGFIQDEYNRLTVPRRAHEYQHHYGLSLLGKAVSDLNPADSRSKFIEAFHNMLSASARFFKEDSDTTVIADAFPLLNALQEVHLILAEGAHNQFGDLTWTARAEMMTIQWMLARPEMKEFLRGRYMVPYQEEWMGAVDSMKRLQGWTDTTVTHFYELAVTGERVLLSIRYGDWSDIENIEDQAKTWARSWKPEIQRYIHAYRTVTGVDLAADIVDTRDAATRYVQPSVLLKRRLVEQISAMSRPSNGPGLVAARVSGSTALPKPGRPELPAYRKET